MTPRPLVPQMVLTCMFRVTQRPSDQLLWATGDEFGPIPPSTLMTQVFRLLRLNPGGFQQGSPTTGEAR
jgi:hypothetical protein